MWPEHIDTVALEKIIQEIARVLQIGGIAYISTILEGENNYTFGQVTLIKKVLKGSEVSATFENNGKRLVLICGMIILEVTSSMCI